MIKFLCLISAYVAISLAADFGPDAMSKFGAKRTCIKSTADYTSQRCFYTYIPDCAGKNVPLVFDIHGYMGSPKKISKYSGWISKADEHCFVIVLPSGNIERPATLDSDKACFSVPTGLTKNNGEAAAPCCCAYENEWTDSDFTEDTKFLRNVAVTAIQDVIPKETSNKVTIDSKRIYMAGHSNGCIASMSMAASHSDLVAAVCCHAGVAQTSFPTSYLATPTWVVHGKMDFVTSFYGKPKALSALETHDIIADANGCKERKEVDLNHSKNDGMRYISDGCDNDATVELVALNGIGHFPYLQSDEGLHVDTTQLAWDFCSKHSSVRSPVLCDDSPLKYKQGKKYRDCAWAGKDSNRCKKWSIRSHCPKTCGASYCFVDSTKTFKLKENKEKKKCGWASKKPEKRCRKKGVRKTCRRICATY